MRLILMLLRYFMRLLGSSGSDRNSVSGSTAAKSETGLDFEKWLEHFYKECGREATLAYTTLNQMKNWAVLIVGAALSAVVTISKGGAANAERDAAIFVGAAVAYVFALRFFIRAIICYDNLIRWNNLQKAIVSYKLVPDKTPGMSAEELKEKIRQLYHGWRVPSHMTRPKQLRDNLKLGFGLLLLFPIVFAAAFAGHVVATYFGAAVTFFCVGYTVVELSDFIRSPLFDTPEVFARRRTGAREMFPTPDYGTDYLKGLALTFIISCAIAYWPILRASLVSILAAIK